METGTDTIMDPHAADDTPTTTAVAGAPTTTATTPDVKVTDDGNIVEVGGKKYYREEALHAERTRASNYANTIKQLEPLMPEFERFLAANAQGRTATVNRATRDVQSDYTDDELTGYAITRGYFDQENKPDLKRAQDDLDLVTAVADRRAKRVVQPVAQMTAEDRARDNVQRAMAQQFADGHPVADEKYIQAVAQALPDEMKADPTVGNLMAVIAAGLQSLDERRTGRGRSSRREPVFREGSGGSFEPQGDQLDALDRAAARARGKSPDAWSKLQKSLGGSSVTGTVLEEV